MPAARALRMRKYVYPVLLLVHHALLLGMPFWVELERLRRPWHGSSFGTQHRSRTGNLWYE